MFLPETPSRYILTEDILLAYADHVFECTMYLKKTVLCVTRNADIQVDDETFGVEGGDFRKKMEKLLRQRRRMAVVRVEISRPISDHFKEHFRSRFEVSDAQIFLSRTAPLKLGYAFSSRRTPCRKKACVSQRRALHAAAAGHAVCRSRSRASRPLCSGIFCCPIRMRGMGAVPADDS